MKYFSLFTGVGGFEIGIQNAYENNSLGRIKQTIPKTKRNGKIIKDKRGVFKEWEYACVGFSEIDKYANQVLKYRFPETKNYGDIKKINWSEVPDFDLLVGGSPCQDFSIAGKRKGILGERSGLVWEFIRCLEEKKPRYFIWENVKGVMSSRRGYDFANIITAFSEVGYNLWWQVLNAKDFGVPQNRERIFVIGFRGESPREIFFEPGNSEQNTGVYEKQTTTSSAINTSIGRNQSDGQYIATPLRFLKRNQRNYQGEYSFTIDGANTGGIKKGTRIRRLTPTECERLMSWPDNWTKWGINEKGEKVEMSDTQRYKMCGNGVVSKVVEELVKTLF